MSLLMNRKGSERMTTKLITFFNSDDWSVLFLDDQLVSEGHILLRGESAIASLISLLNKECAQPYRLKLEIYWLDDDDMEEVAGSDSYDAYFSCIISDEE